MIPAAMRRCAAVAAAALLIAVASGCSVTPPPRTTPNPVEKSALTEARQWAMRDGVPIAADIWTQLWTPTQASEVIRSCVDRGSDGAVMFTAKPLPFLSGGLSFAVGLGGDGSAVNPFSDFDDHRAVLRLVDSCIAAYPIDYRVGRLPTHDSDALYAYDQTILRRCLVAHGQKVPTLPSRTRFENLMRASAPWNAYDQVVVKNRAAWYALSDTCPLLPASIAADAAP